MPSPLLQGDPRPAVRKIQPCRRLPARRPGWDAVGHGTHRDRPDRRPHPRCGGRSFVPALGRDADFLLLRGFRDLGTCRRGGVCSTDLRRRAHLGARRRRAAHRHDRERRRGPGHRPGAARRGRGGGAVRRRRSARCLHGNDNLRALGFYQRNGFVLAALHPGAVGRIRRLQKPWIPEIAANGIPIRDQLDLDKRLDGAGRTALEIRKASPMPVRATGRAGGRRMDAPKFDKSRLPSRHVTEGPARAPHRSYYYAMGITEEEIHQPFVGVATCWNEAAPCNIALNRQAQAVKHGVKKARRHAARVHHHHRHRRHRHGPRGDALLARLPRRHRRHGRAHHARPLLRRARRASPAATRRLPGMMMAMVRLNVPSVFIYGGSILPGRYEGRDVTVQDVFEAVGPAPGRQHVRRRARDPRAGGLPVAPAPAAASTPPTPWPASPRRSASRS